jgi:uncharacterized protein
MLTGDLLRATRRKGRIQPRLVDPSDLALLGTAAGLIAEVHAHIGRSRGELEHVLDIHAPAGAEHAVERGLVKLLLDRCTFETRAKTNPEVLREALFDRSTAAWRSRPLAELPVWRAEVVNAVGASYGLTQAGVEDALYADLEANQGLIAFETLPPERLLLRYNVALVQGLLLRADGMNVLAPWPEPGRVRQLFRWLKFFGLLFEVTRTPDGSLHLSVDGPLSVLEHASRYGLNLAQFFAALLLWQGPWSLTAQLRVGKRAQNAELVLEPHPWLKSPLPDQGAWVPEAVRDFVAAFNAREVDCGWLARPAERIVRLSGNAYLIPDFEFVQMESGRRVLMEHVLYPSPERIARSLGLAKQAIAGTQEGAPFAGYWIACKRAAGLPEDERLFAYRRTLLTKPVRERLEAGVS